jgi:hypothetical protein
MEEEMMMIIKIRLGMMLLAAVCLIGAVQAAINTIPTGGTVFIGEEGLDISSSMGGGTMIEFYAAGSNPTTDSPAKVLTVTPTNFFVNPADFSGYTGPWYVGHHTNMVAFYVQDSSLRIRIYDVQTGRDATGLKIVAGEEMQFRIDTNLYLMADRSGVPGAPVTIHVRDPNGVEYSSLLNMGGLPTSLVDIPVNSASFYTGPVWYINAPYITGVYDIWAVCNANHMEDNYPEPGKTITPVLEQPIGEGAVNITVTTPTATATPTPTTPVPTTTTPVPTTTTPVPTSPPPTTTTLPVTTITVSPTTTTPGFGVLAAVAAGILALFVLRKFR